MPLVWSFLRIEILSIQTYNNLTECHSSVCEMMDKALNLRDGGKLLQGFSRAISQSATL